MEELPERIKIMSSRLNEDYTYSFFSYYIIQRCLKIVYDEWIGYNAWKWKIQEQISSMTNESKKVQFVQSDH